MGCRAVEHLSISPRGFLRLGLSKLSAETRTEVVT